MLGGTARKTPKPKDTRINIARRTPTALRKEFNQFKEQKIGDISAQKEVIADLLKKVHFGLIYFAKSNKNLTFPDYPSEYDALISDIVAYVPDLIQDLEPKTLKRLVEISLVFAARLNNYSLLNLFVGANLSAIQDIDFNLADLDAWYFNHPANQGISFSQSKIFAFLNSKFPEQLKVSLQNSDTFYTLNTRCVPQDTITYLQLAPLEGYTLDSKPAKDSELGQIKSVINLFNAWTLRDAFNEEQRKQFYIKLHELKRLIFLKADMQLMIERLSELQFLYNIAVQINRIDSKQKKYFVTFVQDDYTPQKSEAECAAAQDQTRIFLSGCVDKALKKNLKTLDAQREFRNELIQDVNAWDCPHRGFDSSKHPILQAIFNFFLALPLGLFAGLKYLGTGTLFLRADPMRKQIARKEIQGLKVFSQSPRV